MIPYCPKYKKVNPKWTDYYLRLSKGKLLKISGIVMG